MSVVEAVSLWETRRVFQGLWEGGGAEEGVGDSDSTVVQTIQIMSFEL